MKYIKLGKTDIVASEIGFGTLVMSFGQLNLSDEEGAEILLHGLKNGINLIDTAQFYRTYRSVQLALDKWETIVKSGEVRPSAECRCPIIVSKSLTSDYSDMMDAIEEARYYLRRGTIDVFLLHEVFGLDDLAAREEAKEALENVGLNFEAYIDRPVDAKLSGGEIKRIEIAGVLLRDSKVVVFDEPEAGIDLWSFNNLIRVFEKLRESRKCSIVIISHQERILQIAEEIVMIQDGAVGLKGNKDKIFPSLLCNKDCDNCKNGI